MGVFGDIVSMNVGQIWQTPVLPSADCTGMTVIITGANTGLGLEAAKHFYRMNVSQLILACRNAKKGEEASKTIRAIDQGASHRKIEVWSLDQSVYQSVLDFGKRIEALPRLDILVANAGIVVKNFERFEGNESSLTVNVISTLLVGFLALPKLRSTSKVHQRPSHLVFTGTVVHIFAKHQELTSPRAGTIIRTLNDEKTADMEGRYPLSKLILLLCVRQMALMSQEEKSQNGSVVINYVNPGWCKTDLFRYHDPGAGGRLGLQLIGRSAEAGARAIVWAAFAGSESHGRYLSESRIKPESTWVRSSESLSVEKSLWTEVTDILETIKPGVCKI